MKNFKKTLQIIVFSFIFIQTALVNNSFAKTFNAVDFTLKNGMQVIIIENHRAPVISHMVWYKTGAADEPRGVSGTAHFLEHLLFKGTQKIKSGEFSKTVQRNGGHDNAFTSQDYTAYYQNIASDRLEMVMEMESDRMRNLNITEDVINAERQVIIEERRQRTDNNAHAKFREQMNNALFVNHPYDTPVIGWLHEMKQLTLKNTLDFYNKFYAPNNAILIISGDIKPDKAHQLAKKYYGVIPANNTIKRIRTQSPPLIAERRVILSDPQAGNPTLQISYRAKRGLETLEIATTILGGDTSSRLHQELVIDKKYATYVGASYDPTSLNDTQLTIYAMPTPDTDIATLENAIFTVLNDFVKNGPTDKEIQITKNKLTAAAIYDRDSLQGPAMLFGRALTSGFDIDYVENWTDRIEKVQKKNIDKDLFDTFKGINKPVIGILTPTKPAQKGH